MAQSLDNWVWYNPLDKLNELVAFPHWKCQSKICLLFEGYKKAHISKSMLAILVADYHPMGKIRIKKITFNKFKCRNLLHLAGYPKRHQPYHYLDDPKLKVISDK